MQSARLPCPETLLTDARELSQLADRVALPEELVDEPALGFGQSLQGMSHVLEEVGVQVGGGQGVILDHLLGHGPAAKAPFLAMASPDGFDDAAIEEGVERDAATGVELAAGQASGERPWARASSHQSLADQSGGTRQVRIRPQHRAHKTGQAVGSGGVGAAGP